MKNGDKRAKRPDEERRKERKEIDSRTRRKNARQRAPVLRRVLSRCTTQTSPPRTAISSEIEIDTVTKRNREKRQIKSRGARMSTCFDQTRTRAHLLWREANITNLLFRPPLISQSLSLSLILHPFTIFGIITPRTGRGVPGIPDPSRHLSSDAHTSSRRHLATKVETQTLFTACNEVNTPFRGDRPAATRHPAALPSVTVEMKHSAERKCRGSGTRSAERKKVSSDSR